MDYNDLIEKAKNYNFNEAILENDILTRNQFKQRWPLDKLSTMTLEDYCGLEKDSFCYWLEFKKILAGLGGGSSLKFGIYKNKDEGKYYKRNGNNKFEINIHEAEVEFQKIKSLILNIIELAKAEKVVELESLDKIIANVMKLKILSIYLEKSFITVYSPGSLLEAAKSLNVMPEEDLVNYSCIGLNFYINKKLNEIPETRNWSDSKRGSFIWEVFSAQSSGANKITKTAAKTIIGLYLSKFGDNYLNTRFPALSWRKVYESFAANLGDINNLDSFCNSLKNKRDTFDGYFENKREGWKEQDGNPNILNGINEEIFQKYKDLEEDELWSIVSKYIDSSDRQFELDEDEDDMTTSNEKKLKQPLNSILFGPPGTGKTYGTIRKAIEIVNPEFKFIDLEGKDIDRVNIKKEFDRLKNLGQIEFSTFHQSMSYEDFIEGIKPATNIEDQSIKYEIKDGIFKTICERAKSSEVVFKNSDVKLDVAIFYKMSLGGKDRSDIHDYCLSENFIALGYGGDKDLSDLSKITEAQEFKDKFVKKHPELSAEKRFNIQAARFFLKMKIGDIVIISKGNHIIDAIGVVDSEYMYNDDSPIGYCHFRKVKWLAKNLNANPERFLAKQVSQMSIYEFYTKDIKINSIKELLSDSSNTKDKKYVLVIDEINRGNVSQIFGELITLIEEDKRTGATESIEAILPYSKMPFGVPSNVHIIGTMNTADRSVEALDTALRRRFVFEEMPPSLEVLEKNLKFKDSKIDLVQILKTINQRLEKLLNKDHLIGHSFFIKVKDLNDLRVTFTNEIIPLLQEYFYGDFGKIGLVLGSGFVENIAKLEAVKFATFEGYDSDDLEARPIYKIKDLSKLKDDEFKNVVLSILGK